MPNTTSVEQRNESRRKNYEGTRANATNGGMPWLRPELRAVHSRSWQRATNLTDRELSVILGRSVQAIQVKRAKTEAPS